MTTDLPDRTLSRTGEAHPRARATRRRLGVEEEFHLVDTETRRLAPRAAEVLAGLDDATYVAELQRCVVEINSSVVDDLLGLRNELTSRREVLIRAADAHGLSVVAAGSVPLAPPEDADVVTDSPRYVRMLSDYQLLAREQLICGTQVHVDVADRDEAVDVATRIAHYLPVLLALTASSPFSAVGEDSGYASMRTLIWSRWPTTGLSSGRHSAAEYDALVDDLIAGGIISDPGMIYFDVRPASRVPTLELRICDSCPSTDTIVLVAALFRALVVREAALRREGTPTTPWPAVVARGASWRAARSGVEGDLVDPRDGIARPAAQVVRGLVALLAPELEANGDREVVAALTDQALLAGSSAARQRRAYARRGLLTDVVDLLIAETQGGRIVGEIAPELSILAGYATDEAVAATNLPPVAGADACDEVVTGSGDVRVDYSGVFDAIAALGTVPLRLRAASIADSQRADGITFRVTGEAQARVLPLDLAPRIVTAAEWKHIVDGGTQRTLALDAFLRDVYGPQQIVRDGIVPPELLDRAPGYRSSGRLGADRVRAHVNGLDLVNDGSGNWFVIEDNLRIPSGVAYAIWNRSLLDRFMPELPRPAGLLDVESVFSELRATLEEAVPRRYADNPRIALITEGPDDSAYAEHSMLARRMGVPIVTHKDISFEHGNCYHHLGTRPELVNVLYLRSGEDMLLTSKGHGGEPLHDGLVTALHRGNLALVNALGNGVADDKAISAYVPRMIDYYLGEKPILSPVPTFQCSDRDQRDHVLANLDKLVTKPIDGAGGSGVLIGPNATEAELKARIQELTDSPEKFIAQEVVNLSTHPTFDGETFHPHRIDLRVFVHVRDAGGSGPTTAHVVPAALTRVAAAGTMIVNSSVGGGTKDTWILGA